MYTFYGRLDNDPETVTSIYLPTVFARFHFVRPTRANLSRYDHCIAAAASIVSLEIPLEK